jgi:uncharacterized protein YabN with tetrapyrrole methylase and pyrophosphatase domain
MLSTTLQRKAVAVGMAGLGVGEQGTVLSQRVSALESEDRALAEAEPTRATSESGMAQRIGDVLFEMANLSRRLGIDPEQALRATALTYRDQLVEGEGTTSNGGGT